MTSLEELVTIAVVLSDTTNVETVFEDLQQLNNDYMELSPEQIKSQVTNSMSFYDNIKKYLDNLYSNKNYYNSYDFTITRIPNTDMAVLSVSVITK